MVLEISQEDGNRCHTARPSPEGTPPSLLFGLARLRLQIKPLYSPRFTGQGIVTPPITVSTLFTF